MLRFDAFFADPADTGSEAPDYTLRLRVSLDLERGGDPEWGSGFATRFALPRLEKKLHVYIDNLQRDALPGRQEQKAERQPDDINAGVGIDLLRRMADLVSVDGGVSFDPMPKAFAELQFRHYFLEDPWKGVFTERLYWKSRTGFGEITSVDFIRRFGSNRLVRSNSAGKWAENTDGLEMSQSLSLDKFTHFLGAKLTPAVGVSGHTTVNETMVDSYALWITWRRWFIKRWLYINLSPEIDYPRRNDFEFTPSIWIAFDVYAGVLPDD